MKSKVLVALAATLALSACTTTNPYTGQSQLSNTAGGTLLGVGGGAVAGAIVGAAVGGDPRVGALIGCVQVARLGDDLAYLGMLTVEPTLQASGLGRRLLAAAESEAIARFGARRMEMTVIHRRTELIAWYERRGYAPTGETRPFPVDPPRHELEFAVLEKAL